MRGSEAKDYQLLSLVGTMLGSYFSGGAGHVTSKPGGTKSNQCGVSVYQISFIEEHQSM